MKLRPLVVATLAALSLSGCVASPTANEPGTLSVVVGLYPYAYLAQAVGGDRITVTNLTKPGAEPHDLELSAVQVAAVGSSDLTIYEKTLQPAVDAAVDQTTPAHTLDVTTIIPLEDHAIDEDGATAVDPHIWLDPVHMVTLAKAIADQLSTIDPTNAATYTTNLGALTTELNGLDQSYTTGLAHCERSAFITTHAAFGYLAERYGLSQIPIAGVEPDTDPSPDRIAEIQQTAIKDGITTVFFETLVSPALATSIAEDLGLKTDILDPIEGITDQSRGDDYPSIMASNLTALTSANGCS
ncbi:MAG: metal ABC transporter substrate-binding protein [Propionibacteriaceae bacterium]|nr:metal ABC transporter substrate-binding protein [Propionibacteriaceae bacterium]